MMTSHPAHPGDDDEYDTSMLAKDSELPSDEEELAAQLKHAYHDQQALDEKQQIIRLKERFIQVYTALFRVFTSFWDKLFWVSLKKPLY